MLFYKLCLLIFILLYFYKVFAAFVSNISCDFWFGFWAALPNPKRCGMKQPSFGFERIALKGLKFHETLKNSWKCQPHANHLHCFFLFHFICLVFAPGAFEMWLYRWSSGHLTASQCLTNCLLWYGLSFWKFLIFFFAFSCNLNLV